MKLHLICCSPNEDSVSRIMAKAIPQFLPQDITLTYTDVMDLPATWVTKAGVEAMPFEWQQLSNQIEQADGVIFVTPVYCYSAASPMIAITEATCAILKWKPTLMLSAAGSIRSYTALGGVMKNMIFESSTLVMPATVVATEDDIEDLALKTDLSRRLEGVTVDFVEFSRRLQGFKAEA